MLLIFYEHVLFPATVLKLRVVYKILGILSRFKHKFS